MTSKNQVYSDFAIYNIWANNRLIQNLEEQDDRILELVMVSSFPTIKATIKHIWFGETGWLSRLNGHDWETSVVDNFSGHSHELFRLWQSTSQQLRGFAENEDLEKEVKFEHKGESFSIPSKEIILTLFNHGSYHRGQVVTMLRQQGVTEITQLDYIEWVREKARGNIL